MKSNLSLWCVKKVVTSSANVNPSETAIRNDADAMEFASKRYRIDIFSNSYFHLPRLFI